MVRSLGETLFSKFEFLFIKKYRLRFFFARGIQIQVMVYGANG